MAAKKYSSVSNMLDDIGLDSEVQQDYRKVAGETRLARMLFAQRCKAEMTQTEMAERLGCRQSVISRIENSTDAKLSMEDLLRYARALDMQLGIGFHEKKSTVADRVKYHLHCLDKGVKELLELAGDDLSIVAGAAGVFEGAAQQFVKTLVESAEHVNKVLEEQVGDGDDSDRLRLLTDADVSQECYENTVCAAG